MTKSYLAGAKIVRASMDSAATVLSDEQALSCAAIFPLWSASSVAYAKGDRVQYESTLYKCLTAHTSQESWKPDVSPSLWVRMDDPAVEWPDWVQPLGSHDAYPKGAKVTHGGKRWISDVDNNTWEPGIYGWSEAE